MLIARQVMSSDVVTAPAEATVAAVLATLREHGVRQLPVVDPEGRFVGVASERALADRVAEGEPAGAEAVTTCLDPEPLVAEEDSRLADLVEDMLERKARAVPVVDVDRRVVGTIAAFDVMRGLHAVHADRGAGPYLGVERVLVPIGNDDLGLLALRLVVKLFKGAEIHAIHVLGVPSSMVPSAIISKVDPGARVQQVAAGLKKRVIAAGIDPMPILKVRLGSPADEIVEYAEQNDIRLIVIPSRERHGMRRVLLGSVAEHVVRHSHCPSLVLRGSLPELWSIETGE
ncbi:MAG: CBS domain-containing protein [Deltaproteobacteria bacterium]|nr:MAG: CBS domain-containing protein [Deltaproteobacteria bacterium]